LNESSLLVKQWQVRRRGLSACAAQSIDGEVVDRQTGGGWGVAQNRGKKGYGS
jgi:hypothetical protein